MEEASQKKNKAFDDIKTVLDSVLTNLEKNITPLLKANIKSSSPSEGHWSEQYISSGSVSLLQFVPLLKAHVLRSSADVLRVTQMLYQIFTDQSKRDLIEQLKNITSTEGSDKTEAIAFTKEFLKKEICSIIDAVTILPASEEEDTNFSEFIAQCDLLVEVCKHYGGDEIFITKPRPEAIASLIGNNVRRVEINGQTFILAQRCQEHPAPPDYK